MKNVFLCKTTIGKLGIADDGKGISNIFFNENDIPKDVIIKETEIIRECINQINEYFMGDRKEFNLPLSIKGTEFQKKVWKALTEIPYGETRSYKEIAEMVNSPKAYRAVGMANNKNPLSIIIPCHRVIGSNGKLVGYGGGIDIKIKLLDLEKNYKSN